MKDLKYILITLIFSFTACSVLGGQQPISSKTKENSLVTETLPIISTRVLPTVTVSSTSQTGTLIKRCIDVTATATFQDFSAGALLITNENKLYLFDLSTQEKISLPLKTSKGNITSFDVSPNKQYLFYIEEYQEGENTKNEFTLIASDGRTILSTPWKPDYGLAQAARWLNNNYIKIFPLNLTNNSQVYFSPFTSQIQVLSFSNFPDLYIDIDVQRIAESPLIVPSQDLRWAIYISASKSNGYQLSYSLWDLLQQREIWRKNGVEITSVPKWSLDGKNLAVVARPSDNDFRHTDIYVIAPDGKENQITNLVETAPVAIVRDFAWSLNGQYIAFWADIRQTIDAPVAEQLVVVDVITKKAENYCLLGNGTFTNAPIWSPDNSQLIVHSDRYVLIDIIKKSAFYLPGDIQPNAWMASAN